MMLLSVIPLGLVFILYSTVYQYNTDNNKFMVEHW